MRSAYNETWLYNLEVTQTAKRWLKSKLISVEQFNAIANAYTSGFFHPNLIIRILILVATFISLGGVTGILGLIVTSAEADETTFSVLALLYGLGSFLILDLFIKSSNYYKSGLTEAILYHSIGFTIGGIAGITDFNEDAVLLACILITAFAAYRYLDLLSTLAALCSFGGFVFYEFYEMEGVFQNVIPFVFILVFTPLYFLFRRTKKQKTTGPWQHCLLMGEAFSLLVIYAAGNYFVVRELSIELMELSLQDGEDIPFAFLFYFLTVVIPAGYLYFAIVRKDVVLLRVSLLALAFSVFTFKYYFSLGHPEITLTVAGAVAIGITLGIFRYLKVPRHGWTHENLLSEKWADANAEAFVISQTLGGNKVAVDESFQGGGGSFGGGGASGEY